MSWAQDLGRQEEGNASLKVSAPCLLLLPILTSTQAHLIFKWQSPHLRRVELIHLQAGIYSQAREQGGTQADLAFGIGGLWGDGKWLGFS